MRRSPLLVLLAVVVLVAGCSSTSDEGATTTSTATAGRGSVLAGYPTGVDVVTPLVITPMAPDPIPVPGTDGKIHVDYELEVLNYSPRDATLIRLDTLAGGPDGEVVASVGAAGLAERTLIVWNPVPAPGLTIPAGRTAIILVDDVYDTLADVPATVTPRLDVTFGPLAPGAEVYARTFPGDPMSLIGAPVTTSTESPVVIGPPVAGADWWVNNGCCGLSPHRGAIFGVGGRLNALERYAIDFLKYDVSLDLAAQAAALAAGELPTSRGDRSENESYLAYGEPLLAVADGTVVAVESNQPDIEPQVLPPALNVLESAGNYISLQIGDGVYAMYVHMVPGSATVKVGDKVTRGQVIGRLGNSGNTSEAHLHFQLQRTPSQASGDNLPYVFDSFTFVGMLDETTGFSSGPNAGPRTDQLPLSNDIVDFPTAP